MPSLFPLSERARALDAQLAEFMAEYVLPAEPAFAAWNQEPEHRWQVPPQLEALKARARAAGLWNLFLPPAHGGLSNLDYAPLAERMGRSLLAPEIFNCAAPIICCFICFFAKNVGIGVAEKVIVSDACVFCERQELYCN